MKTRSLIIPAISLFLSISPVSASSKRERLLKEKGKLALQEIKTKQGQKKNKEEKKKAEKKLSQTKEKQKAIEKALAKNAKEKKKLNKKQEANTKEKESYAKEIKEMKPELVPASLSVASISASFALVEKGKEKVMESQEENTDINREKEKLEEKAKEKRKEKRKEKEKERKLNARLSKLEIMGMQYQTLLLKNKGIQEKIDLVLNEMEGEAKEEALHEIKAMGNTAEKGSEEYKVIEKAFTRLHCPYVYGACHTAGEIANPEQRTFDCSGLVCWAYAQAGHSIGTQTSSSLEGIGRSVDKLKPGDILLFSDNGEESGIHHTGLYIGGGKMIQAPQSGDVVKVSDITTGYYARQLYDARRVLG